MVCPNQATWLEVQTAESAGKVLATAAPLFASDLGARVEHAP